MQIDEAINVLSEFCGKRDITELTQRELQNVYGFSQADVFVLFGGSILEGRNVLANAIQQKVARKYIIVGGAGHTTETLRIQMHNEYNGIATDGLTARQEKDEITNTLYYGKDQIIIIWSFFKINIIQTILKHLCVSITYKKIQRSV